MPPLHAAGLISCPPTLDGDIGRSLYAAGYSPREVCELLCESPPLRWLAPSWPPCQGIFSLDPAIARLTELLPPTFEELSRDFSCGVVRTWTLSRTLRTASDLDSAPRANTPL